MLKNGLFLITLTLTVSLAFSELRTGVDLSFVPRLEQAGAEWYVVGQARDPIEIYNELGITVVRLRLWHTPSEPWHGLDSTTAFAQRIREAGMEWMLDLHYSDTWADPGHQQKPSAWEGLDFATLVDSVYAYSNNVMRHLRAASALPRYVQVGNEITPGFMWNEGRVGGEWETPAQWAQFAALLEAGIHGVTDSLSEDERPQIILHADAGGSNATCRWFFDHLAAEGVEFDIIGLSYYPWWHGPLDSLERNVTDLVYRYGKEIQIVETAYPWTLEWADDTHNYIGLESQLLPGFPATPEGQQNFLTAVRQILEDVPGDRGGALLYWEPSWVTTTSFGSSWENLALYDFSGEALPGLGALALDAAPEPGMPVIPGVFAVSDVWPNPFNSTARLRLTLTQEAVLRCSVYNIDGCLVRAGAWTSLTPGTHTLSVDLNAHASGLYLFHVESADGIAQCVKGIYLR